MAAGAASAAKAGKEAPDWENKTAKANTEDKRWQKDGNFAWSFIR
jgi:hypothetical protein